MVLQSWSPNGATHETGFDVRNWSVHTLIDNALVGVVHDVLMAEANSPRYLNVALDSPAKHVLVPIGQARALRDQRLVWLPGLAQYQLEAIPSFKHEPLSRGDEARLLSAYNATMAGVMPRRGYRVLSTRHRRRPAPSDPARLVPLSGHAELRVASGEADPRDWSVIDRAGIVRGKISDLLVDLAAMKVRYVICELAADGEAARAVLVPVEFLRLDSGMNAAQLPAFSEQLLSTLPDHEAGPPDRDTEILILERFAEAQEAEEFYRNPRFDAGAFFGPA